MTNMSDREMIKKLEVSTRDIGHCSCDHHFKDGELIKLLSTVRAEQIEKDARIAENHKAIEFHTIAIGDHYGELQYHAENHCKRVAQAIRTQGENT